MAFGNRLGREQEFFFHRDRPSVAQARHFTKDRAAARPVKLVFRLLARLPLAANHALGAFLGRVVYYLVPRYRWRLLDNLRASGIPRSASEAGRIARANAAEIGKGATEMAWALFRSSETVATVRERIGWDAVERLRESGR